MSPELEGLVLNGLPLGTLPSRVVPYPGSLQV